MRRKGLCGDRSEHEPHSVTSGALAPFWCTAEQSDREPGRSERRVRSNPVAGLSFPKPNQEGAQ